MQNAANRHGQVHACHPPSESRTLSRIGLLTLVSVLLVACNGGNGNPTGSNPTPTPDPTPTVTPGPTPTPTVTPGPTPTPALPSLSFFAGSLGGSGNTDGSGAAARFSGLLGLAADSSGNIYVADTYNHTIRKITSTGVVSTLAGMAGAYGTVDGTGDTARFTSPADAAVDGNGNVFVAESGSHVIRRITPTGIVSTFAGAAGIQGSADGSGGEARFNRPSGLAVDSAGNVYVADQSNYTIRKINPAGEVTTIAGQAGSSGALNGFGANARFSGPQDVAVDGTGVLYVSDAQAIRRIGTGGFVSTLAGTAGSGGSIDGTGAAARFNGPAGIATDSTGNLFVADSQNEAIRKVTPEGVVTTLAGSAGIEGSADGTGALAQFYVPNGLTTDGAGNVYVGDSGNSNVRKITPAGVVSTFAGAAEIEGSVDGPGSVAQFYNPIDLVTDDSGNVYVADSYNYTIRKITPAGVVSTLAGTAGIAGSADGVGAEARFNLFGGIAIDDGGNLYVSVSNFSHTIRKITPAGVVTTLAGSPNSFGSADGVGSNARFYYPAGLAVDEDGNVYVADSQNKTVRKVTPDGVVSTFAGVAGLSGSADGSGTTALFASPNGLAIDSSGNLFVADSDNNTVRKITPDGVVSTLAGVAGIEGNLDGAGAAALFHAPLRVTTDGSDKLYVADTENHTIRKVTQAGVVSTLVGVAGQSGFVPGPLPGIINQPDGVSVTGNLLYLISGDGIAVVTLP